MKQSANQLETDSLNYRILFLIISYMHMGKLFFKMNVCVVQKMYTSQYNLKKKYMFFPKSSNTEFIVN